MKLGVAGIIALLLVGCKSTGLTEEQAVIERKHLAEQLLCVDKAKTLEESRACRCEVEKKYGRDCK